MSRTRKRADIRKEEIIAVAIRQAQLLGLDGLQRERIAAEAGIAQSLISHHFGSMPQLRRDVVRHAIKQRNAIVVAQAIRLKHPAAKDIPDDLQSQVDLILASH